MDSILIKTLAAVILGFVISAVLGKYLVPALRRWTEAGLALSDAAALTLLALIAGTEDTNMIHRGGLARARQCRVAEELYRRATPENFRALLNDLDRQYIREHLSPGGCADLLALSLMLFFLEQDGLLA